MPVAEESNPKSSIDRLGVNRTQFPTAIEDREIFSNENMSNCTSSNQTSTCEKSVGFNFSGILFLLLCFFYGYMGAIFVVGPFFLLLLINNDLFNLIVSKLMALWFRIGLTYLRILVGTKIYLYTDKAVSLADMGNSIDNTLFIMNHRGALDWIYFFRVVVNYFSADTFKIVLKKSLKNVIGLGWVMQTNLYLFLSRIWSQDEQKIARLSNYFIKSKKRIQLLLFCEGTFPNKRTVASSNRFALKNNLPFYKHVLHPKTKGFCEILRYFSLFNTPQDSIYEANPNRNTLFNHFETIYDCTIAYKQDDCHDELHVLKGNIAREFHIYMQKFEINQLIGNKPAKLTNRSGYECKCSYDKENSQQQGEFRNRMPSNYENQQYVLEKWLQDRWSLKEQKLDYFSKYLTFGKNIHSEELKDKNFIGSILITMFFMVYLSYCAYKLTTSSFFFHYFVIMNFVCIFMSLNDQFFNHLTRI